MSTQLDDKTRRRIAEMADEANEWYEGAMLARTPRALLTTLATELQAEHEKDKYDSMLAVVEENNRLTAEIARLREAIENAIRYNHEGKDMKAHSCLTKALSPNPEAKASV